MVKKTIFIEQPEPPMEVALAASQDLPRKVKTAHQKALETATWARTMTKVIISRNNKEAPFWHVINFLGAGKQESGGIIDLLAIRKDHSKTGALPPGDGFEIILVQVKGGGAAMPNPADIQRMQAVKQHYGAKAVVLSSWKKGSAAVFRVLSNTTWGDPVDPDAIFGGRADRTNTVAKSQRKTSKNVVIPVTISQKRSKAAKAAWETRRKTAAK